MAKERKRGNREAKKPKSAVKKTAAAPVSPFSRPPSAPAAKSPARTGRG